MSSSIPKLAQLADALAGRYEVEREIGAGGMATVYVARDVRHHRKVALKVLNPELGAVLGAERFLAEIEVTANLQHPHLLPLFDSGEANGLLFYVMPFVEGESLRARLEREKQLPVNEAVRIAVAVATALDYAHGHGVIHRDLKPENILLQAGHPVIADFGIALAVSKAGGARVTQTGISLGTPQYMSPEQATGDRAIDGRTDIYSLGAVLYEMLTGDAPHVASTAQAIIAKVLTERPPSVRTARPAVPTHVALSIEKALAKLPADRWSTAREFVDALEKRTPADPMVSAELPTASAGGGRRVAMRWLASPSVWIPVALVGVGAASWALGRRSVVTDDAVVRASLAIPSDAFLASVLFVGPPIDISPDGRTVAYTAQSVAGPQIAIRRLDEFRATILPNTVGGVYPVFSADGQAIVFFSGGSWKRIAVDGGPASLLSTGAITTGNGASVAPDGTVIIGDPTSQFHGLGTVSSPRDRVLPLTEPDTARGQFFHSFPRLLPDGETVLFASRGRTGASDARIGIASLKTRTADVLDLPGIYPLGVIDGSLIYVRSDGEVMGVRVDRGRRRVIGRPIDLRVQVKTHGNGSVEAALSVEGTLTYATGSITSRLSVVDSAGTARPLFPEARQFTYPRFSPDGRRILVSRAEAVNDIWVYDVASGIPARVTADQGTSDRAEWTGDGKRVVFRSNRLGRNLMWVQPADRTAAAELLLDYPSGVPEGVMTHDGSALVFRTNHAGTELDIMKAALTGDRKVTPVAQTPFSELMPTVSPNDRWVAYTSNEAGLMDVYVQSLNGSTERIPVSSGGGTEPRWSPDGRRIYYRANHRVIAATLAVGTSIAVTTRDTLFDDRFVSDGFHQSWDVAPDGKHFLMLDPVDNDRQIVFVRNWAREVRERMRGVR